MSILSPLRYPGGKSKISNFFKQFVKDNGLLDGVYVEPYAGGASVALSLSMSARLSSMLRTVLSMPFGTVYCMIRKICVA